MLIVGAGPTGLGAAWRLHEAGVDEWELIEASAAAGGLASSFVDDLGFTWDVGGHVQFSHYAYYDRALDSLGGDWLEHERESWILACGSWVPYPFQYNLHRLPEEPREWALAELEAATRSRDGGPPASFGEWIDRSFGEGIAALFMRPYNRKVWGYPLEELGVGWIGERVAAPDAERARRNAREGRDDVSWGPNNRFRFPRRGGTGWIWKEVAARLPAGRLRFGTRLLGVDPRRRTARLSDGRSVAFDSLITTVPLDLLCGLADGVPPSAAARLRHSAVHVLGVAIRGPRPDALRRRCWMYFPDEASPYYRVTVFSNYSPHHVPSGEGHWSLMAEVCETPWRRVDAGNLPRDVVASLRRDGLLPPAARVLGVWHHRAEHGYPTPFLGRDEVLAGLRSVLEPRRVFSRGRFGAWKYEVSNQDHSFMQGVEVIDRLLGIGDEPTLEQPALVNGGAFARAPAQAPLGAAAEGAAAGASTE